MVGTIVTILACTIIAATVNAIFKWRKMYVAAKQTGFPVFLSPVYMFDPLWLILHKRLVPLLLKLPVKWQNPWLPYVNALTAPKLSHFQIDTGDRMVQRYRMWETGYKCYQDLGVDTFVLATPYRVMLWTCDPKIIGQLERVRPQSQAAIEQTKLFDLYGPTIVSVEGEEWKSHRKVIMSGFTPVTNGAVWRDTTLETEAMIRCWQEREGRVGVMKYWTSKLALHVVSSIFFRMTLTWGTTSVPPIRSDRTMSFEQALFKLISSLPIIFLTPKWLREILPFQSIKEANVAFADWTSYMKELLGDTLARPDELLNKEDKSILEHITLAGTIGSSRTGDKPLPNGSILGNIFMTLIAGHESTGNTLAFALILLAIHPDYQRKVQEELDDQRAVRPKNDWSMENEFSKFQSGWIGAVLKETLRLYTVVTYLLRNVVTSLEVVDSSGNSHIIPEGTMCGMHFAAAFRNPSAWPQLPVSAERRAQLHNSPALDFDPTKWLDTGDVTAAVEAEDGTVPLLFPFGQGPRRCPGRLFAQAEMISAIATIMLDYNLELIVDNEVRHTYGEKEAWERTRDKAMLMMVDDLSTGINLTMMKEIPIRLTSR